MCCENELLRTSHRVSHLSSGYGPCMTCPGGCNAAERAPVARLPIEGARAFTGSPQSRSSQKLSILQTGNGTAGSTASSRGACSFGGSLMNSESSVRATAAAGGNGSLVASARSLVVSSAASATTKSSLKPPSSPIHRLPAWQAAPELCTTKGNNTTHGTGCSVHRPHSYKEAH